MRWGKRCGVPDETALGGQRRRRAGRTRGAAAEFVGALQLLRGIKESSEEEERTRARFCGV